VTDVVGRRGNEYLITGSLILIAAVSWWVTVRLASGMSGTGMVFVFLPFMLGWVAMMAAMMLPAVTPVVRLYARAAARNRVAPTGSFVSGYLLVWIATGVPAYFLWRAMAMPLMDGEAWAARTAGIVLLVAGAYQLTPLKRACLRHCRSPMSVFLRMSANLARSSGAVRAGGTHAVYCFGCCVGLMVVLVAAGSMQLWWAAAIAVVIYLERNGPAGERLALVAAAALAALGVALLANPTLISTLVQGGMA
jgi:predicted metal-binding membrane protein